MSKINSGWIIAIIVIIVLGIVLLINYPDVNVKDDSDDMVIGGGRDSHGCLGAAGYNWNESEKECVREWETGEDRYQVVNFESCVAAGHPIMESYPRKCRTDGGREFVEVIVVKEDDDNTVEQEDNTWIDHSDREETYCKEEDRGAGACISLYDPVCGFFDGSKIQCIKAPCAAEYSNSCEACSDENVLYWIPGNCPST